jgi:hypothetical protein
MDEGEEFENWLAGICKRTLAINEMAQMRTFAKELAEGVTKKFWNTGILSESIRYTLLNPQNEKSPLQYGIRVRDLRENNKEYKIFMGRLAFLSDDESIRHIADYIHNRWEHNWPEIELLEVNRFIKRTDKNHGDWQLSKSAFDLLEEAEPVSIFISYKRSESSAFAMYILTRLKQEGLEAFVDMALIPGEDWHAGLKERITEYDF